MSCTTPAASPARCRWCMAVCALHRDTHSPSASANGASSAERVVTLRGLQVGTLQHTAQRLPVRSVLDVDGQPLVMSPAGEDSGEP